MPGHGLVHTSSPTSPRTGLPASSNTSTAMPSAGPPRVIGVSVLHGVGRQEAGADLGAAGDVDDRAAAAADHLEEPVVGVLVPRLAGGARGCAAHERSWR